MADPRLHVEAVRSKLAEAKTITILTHLNADADTLGTGLGIYQLLKKNEKKTRIEIVNASAMLPQYLDFLPGFERIKSQMDFEESLIISCDCGSLNRLGFELEGREIINVDHHESNEKYGVVNVVIPEYASASQVAYRLFKELYPVDKAAGECFYTALLSDTRYFTTSSVNAEVFEVSKALLSCGVDPAAVAKNLTQRRSLASLRILHRALGNLTLVCDAKVATLFVTQKDIIETGAQMPDMEGVVDYAKSLATVEIALFAMVLKDSIRVSLRSKGADVAQVARHFGGGGHSVAAGFTVKQTALQETIDIIVKIIEETGCVHGKT